MKSDRIISAWSKLDPGDVIKLHMLDIIAQKRKKGFSGLSRDAEKKYMGVTVSRPAFRLVLLVATSVIICIAIISAVYLITSGGPRSPSDSQINMAPGDVSLTQQVTPGENHDTYSSANTSPSKADTLPAMQSANSFMLLGYSIEQVIDGSISLREFDVLDRRLVGRDFPLTMDKYDSVKDIYISGIGLMYIGSNIDIVKFSVDEGFFGLIKKSDMTKSYSSGAIDGMDDVQLIGLHFDNIEVTGNVVVLGRDTNVDDLILVWCTSDLYGADDRDREITIRAEAVFDDRATAEMAVMLEYSPASIKEREAQYRIASHKRTEQFEYYRSIPLEECELIPDSVKRVTYVYRYDVDVDRPIEPGDKSPGVLVISEYGFSYEHDEFTFDENGLMIVAFGDSLGDGDKRGYMVVIRREEDGTTTGMIYRTPLRVQ